MSLGGCGGVGWPLLGGCGGVVDGGSTVCDSQGGRLFWPAVMGYLRIVTHPTILERPLAPATAIENMTRLLARPHIRAAGEGERFWSLYQSEGARRVATPSRIRNWWR